MKRALIFGFGFVLAAAAVVISRAWPHASATERCEVVTDWGLTHDPRASLNHPMGLAWRDGVLYVADADHGAVTLFRDDGSLVAEWSGFDRPVAIAPADNVVYVADFLADRILTLDRGGRIIAKWGQHGHGGGEFDGPSGVAVDRHGNVYVADFYNHRVQKFTGDGRFIRTWGRKGRMAGRFRFPTGLAVDHQDELLVADAYNHRIQTFTTDGIYLTQWGGIGYGFGGSSPGWFRLAKEIALDRTGNVYVADAFNKRIQKFAPDGTLLAVWGSPDGQGPLRYASGVAVNADGVAYVSDFFTNRIWAVTCR